MSTVETPSTVRAADAVAPQREQKKLAHPATEARALLQQLSEAFSVFRECKPLALRVDASIRERMPEIERKLLRSALRMHTASTRYLKAVERSQERFNLEGEVAGEVTAEQREHAAATLKERFAAQAKQHREKRAAEEEKRAAEEAEKRRGEKLQQLVSKFGR